MPFGIIKRVIHSDDDIRGVAVLDRGRNNDLLDACLEIRRQRRLGLEDTGAVNDHIDAVQRQVFQCASTNERQTRAIDRHTFSVVSENSVPTTMHSVELQKMHMHRRIAHSIIDPGNLSAAFQQGLQC